MMCNDSGNIEPYNLSFVTNSYRKKQIQQNSILDEQGVKIYRQ